MAGPANVWLHKGNLQMCGYIKRSHQEDTAVASILMVPAGWDIILDETSRNIRSHHSADEPPDHCNQNEGIPISMILLASEGVLSMRHRIWNWRRIGLKLLVETRGERVLKNDVEHLRVKESLCPCCLALVPTWYTNGILFPVMNLTTSSTV